MKHYDTLKGIGLQFFADSNYGGQAGSGNAGGNAGGNPGANGGQGTQEQNGSGNAQTEKSYTQEQINSMMANEKRTARQAILKELGVDVKDDKEYKAALTNLKKTLDASKSQSQLDAEAKKAAEDARDEANNKVAMLEMKIAALSSGVNPDCLEDVITLAAGKVNETTPVETVMADLKKKYPNFFVEKTNSGTGSSSNPARKQGNQEGEGLGKRLAQSKHNSTKSAYFKNN